MLRRGWKLGLKASLRGNRLPAQPTPRVKRKIIQLLEHTLPQCDLDPKRLPPRFRRQVIKHISAYTMLYRTDAQAMIPEDN